VVTKPIKICTRCACKLEEYTNLPLYIGKSTRQHEVYFGPGMDGRARGARRRRRRRPPPDNAKMLLIPHNDAAAPTLKVREFKVLIELARIRIFARDVVSEGKVKASFVVTLRKQRNHIQENFDKRDQISTDNLPA
jgi:hypothetical protein